MARPAPAEPFFLDTADGARFCLYHPPHGPCRGALVYIHPLAEEMNRARRMAALQARAFAAAGIGVLAIDLQGCGDSEGDFADASWDGWLRDIAAARAWLEGTLGLNAGLWGLRLGALLALAAARQQDAAPARLLLWQPVTSGATHLGQFLRLRLAADMLQAGDSSGGGEALRGRLCAGETLEVAGYGLTHALADGLGEADAARLAPPCPVHWFELAPDATRPLAPAALRIAQAWQAEGVQVQQALVAGPAFWNSPETTVAPDLLDASLGALAGAAHA